MMNLINLILIYTAFLLLAMLFYQLFSYSQEESLAISAVFVILSTFFCALVGRANFVYLILLILSVCSVACWIFDLSFVGKKNERLNRGVFAFFNPSVISLSVIFLYSVVAFRGAIFTYPDEIAQWGPAVKYLYDTGRLPLDEFFSGDSATFSTATIFQYVWTGLVSYFSERDCFVGNFVLAFIPVYLPLDGVKWKNWKRVAFYTIALFLSLNIITYIKYYVLLQDIVLPLWAGSVIAWLLWSDNKRIKWVLLWGMIACIFSMKSLVGPLFVVIIVTVLLIRQYLEYYPNSFKLIVRLRTLLLSLATVASAFVIEFLCAMRARENVYNRISVYAGSRKDKFLIAKGIINRIFMPNSSQQLFPQISFITIFLLVIVAVIVLPKCFEEKKDRLKFVISFSLYSIGCVGFLVIMFVAYLSVFGETDSNIQAGLERYTAYYMLLVVPPVLSLFCAHRTLIKKALAKKMCIAIMFVLISRIDGNFISKASSINLKDDATYELRKKISTECDRITELTNDDADGRIFVYGTLSRFDSGVMTLELGSRYQWDRDCYKYYQRSETDIVTICDIEKYPQLLENGDYSFLLYYGLRNEDLNLKYRYMMENVRNGSLYKLTYDEQNISMKYLGNILEED